MKSSNVLIQKIHDINATGRTALCGYFLSGYNSPSQFYKFIRSLDHIDIIEFGIPTENPFLDGPVIARAHQHVTGHLGLNAESALALIGGIREIPQPRFVMTYAHEGRELDGFIKLCLSNNVHGILAPDIALVEAANISLILSALNLAYVGFVHTEMDEHTVAKTIEICDIVYLKVSTGRTGHKGDFCSVILESIQKTICFIRKIKPDIIISAGIGIQTPDQVQLLSQLGFDMVVVGTSLMQKMDAGLHEVNEYTRLLREATARNP